MASKNDLLSEVERVLKEKYDEGSTSRLPSTAAAAPRAERIDQLVLPDEQRPKMPYTKDQFLVKEDPYLVQWERELRKFLRNLSPNHGHRVSAAMVFEWATGLRIVDLMAAGEKAKGGQRTWRSDLRALNRLLVEYFGKPYMTYIAGHKVPKAYRVPPAYFVYRHRPKTLTLWVEWKDGVKL